MGGHAAHLAGAAAWLPAVAVVAVPLAAYAVLVARRRRRLGRGWSRWRTASLVAGLLLVAAAVAPPLARAAHEDLRGHMVQHLLLGMYAPLGLVLAAPVTLLLGASPPRTGRRVTAVLRRRPVHVLAHPVTAAVLDIGALHVLYLTPLHALAQRSPLVHGLVAVHLLVAGCLFTWAVAGPDPAPRRPGLAVRLGVLVLAGAAHAHLAKLLHARAGDLAAGWGTSVADVEAAAQWMYYGGDGAEVLLAVALCAAWYRRGAQPARRGHSMAGQVSMTTSSPAARARSAAASSTTPSWSQTPRAPRATASSTTAPASSERTNTSTTSTGNGTSASEA
ncbi:cytochrome c oxidase assembly protein [Vallicoccus soli]|uniref:Cytochrome c oxidase assembly protein n=1 Tax=Vallicoccus soli TaxID=2339232 RepID=A0A3A3YV00_9ACTN|nr:cytochrome c oxidase assembly protein [Vallicoccus soli]RJK95330.1 cytochrome c oxidase assembly protein [Vallicoccus soli]